MSNRSFTRREKILLTVLIVIIAVVGYTRFFVMPMQDRLEEQNARKAMAQEQMTLETVKLVKMNDMEQELEAMKAAGVVPNAEVPVYDNIENVMVCLNTILQQATDYSLSFKEVRTVDNSMVERPIDMTFIADDYLTVRSIIDDLYHCRYRCAVESIEVTAKDSLSVENPIQVELSVIFYEKQAE